MKRSGVIGLIISLMMSVFCGCADAGESASRDFYAMDTYMTVTANGANADKAVKAAEKEIKRLDATLNAEDENSEIYRLNKKGELRLSDDTAALVSNALKYSNLTDGAFNPAVHPLMKFWGFTTGKYRVPESKEISSALKLVRTDKINLKENTAEFVVEGLEIDLGGIAKGYASSKVVDIFKAHGVESGIVNLGGNVHTVGYKPDGSEWSVAVEDPNSEDSYLCLLKIHDKAVITSGGYERYFEKDGKTYHHILDPSTGYPVDNGLESVTVVSSDGTMADALSTALFVMGKEKAVEFWRKGKAEFDFVLSSKGGQLVVSEGLRDKITSGYDIEFVSN